jgi:hypothetical protein
LRHESDIYRKLMKRINNFIKEIKRSPFEGTGKPEPLKANYRINEPKRSQNGAEIYHKGLLDDDSGVKIDLGVVFEDDEQ